MVKSGTYVAMEQYYMSCCILLYFLTRFGESGWGFEHNVGGFRHGKEMVREGIAYVLRNGYCLPVTYHWWTYNARPVQKW